MTGIGIMPHIAGRLKQLHLDLEGRVGQLAQYLGLGDDLGGHQVQDEQVQRADILMYGPVFSHDEDVLAFQRRTGGQGVRDLDGHGAPPVCVVCVFTIIMYKRRRRKTPFRGQMSALDSGEKVFYKKSEKCEKRC